MDNEDISLKELLKKVKVPLSGIAGIAALSTIIIIGTTHCNKDKKSEIPEPEQATATTLYDSLEKQLAGNVEPDSVKTFDEGEHILSIRVKYDWANNDELAGYAINNIPEGYEVFQITPYTDFVNNGSATEGYDIWFKNTEPVEVHASYNDVFENYGYYTFGEVIEEEKVLEK